MERHRLSSVDNLLHLLDQSLAHLALNTGSLARLHLAEDLDGGNLSAITRHIQHITLISQAWAVLRKAPTNWDLESLQPAELLTFAARPFQAQREMLSIRCASQMPAIVGDRHWLSRFALRIPLHIAMMRLQSIIVTAGPDNGDVWYSYRACGEVRGDLSDTAMQLLWKAGGNVIKGMGGAQTIDFNQCLEEWTAMLRLPAHSPAGEPRSLM